MDRSEGVKPEGREGDLFQVRIGGKPLVANMQSVATQGTHKGPLPNSSGPLWPSGVQWLSKKISKIVDKRKKEV